MANPLSPDTAAPAQVPTRAERRTNTTQPQPSTSAPEDPTQPEARLPHERDESVDTAHGSVRQPDMEQAYHDVQRGLQDTDKGPPMHRAYQKQKQ